jgi:hypothetical protein
MLDYFSLLTRKSIRRKIMKNFRLFCAGTALMLALGFSALAGDIGAPGVSNPQPLKTTSVLADTGFPGASAAGEISTLCVTDLDPVTEAALSLLESLLALF